MNESRNNNVRRNASNHLAMLALAGIIATMSLAGVAIWTAHERAQASAHSGDDTATDTSRAIN